VKGASPVCLLSCTCFSDGNEEKNPPVGAKESEWYQDKSHRCVERVKSRWF
jgi:hypothetical protein